MCVFFCLSASLPACLPFRLFLVPSAVDLLLILILHTRAYHPPFSIAAFITLFLVRDGPQKPFDDSGNHREGSSGVRVSATQSC